MQRNAKHIDLNCDMGEGFGRYSLGNDTAMLRVVTSANIACGMHAGDPRVMRQTVASAVEQGVAVGAHPGYPDLQGFGRRAMSIALEELEAILIYQLGALAGFAQAVKRRAADRPATSLTHVKPHGALYNTAARDAVVAQAVAQAIAAFDPALIVVTLPNSALAESARSLGLAVAREGFADRAYQQDGTLVPRRQPGAVIHDPVVAAERAVRMVTEGKVKAITGEIIDLNIDTLCIHGDTPDALQIAQTLRKALEKASIEIRPLAKR
jgi:UPF0271 protein